MARIRSIKPEFPQSESMGRVSREARLCFVLLWTVGDDEGRLRGNSRMLASLLYPYDADAGKRIDAWLDELQRERCIHRYVVNGDQYIEIAHFREHQRIDKPSASKLPARPENPPNDGHSDDPREDSRGIQEDSRNIREDSESVREDSLRNGMEWKGEEGRGCAPARAPARATPVEPTAKHRELAASLGLNCDAQWERFKDYVKANGKRYRDTEAAFRNWLRNEQTFVRPGQASRSGTPSLDVGTVIR